MFAGRGSDDRCLPDGLYIEAPPPFTGMLHPWLFQGGYAFGMYGLQATCLRVGYRIVFEGIAWKCARRCSAAKWGVGCALLLCVLLGELFYLFLLAGSVTVGSSTRCTAFLFCSLPITVVLHPCCESVPILMVVRRTWQNRPRPPPAVFNPDDLVAPRVRSKRAKRAKAGILGNLMKRAAPKSAPESPQP